MKQRVDRVKVYHGTWAQAAEEEGPGSITIASLLDSMDWMPPSMIAENIAKVVANMDQKKGRIFWRSFADRVHSPVLAHLKGTTGADVRSRRVVPHAVHLARAFVPAVRPCAC